MPVEIETEHGVVEFPDGTSRLDMEQAIYDKWPDIAEKSGELPNLLKAREVAVKEFLPKVLPPITGTAGEIVRLVSETNPVTFFPRLAHEVGRSMGLIPMESQPISANDPILSVETARSMIDTVTTGPTRKPGSFSEGAKQFAAEFISSMSSPNMSAALVAGAAAPRLAKAALAAGFGGSMASAVPETAAEFGAASVEGPPSEVARTGLHAASAVAFPAAIAAGAVISSTPKAPLVTPEKAALLPRAAAEARKEGEPHAQGIPKTEEQILPGRDDAQKLSGISSENLESQSPGQPSGPPRGPTEEAQALTISESEVKIGEAKTKKGTEEERGREVLTVPAEEPAATTMPPVPSELAPDRISAGPGAAAKGEPGSYMPIQQLADQIAVVGKDKPPKEAFSLIEKAKEKAREIGDAFKEGMVKAVAVKDALWNLYSKLPEFTEERAAVGNWNYALQKADHEVRQFVHAIDKQIPNKNRQVAITNWIQADGDMALLKDRADQSKTSKLRKGYQDAQTLTPKELEVAQLLKEYFDRQLERGVNEGILGQGIEHYVTQVWKRENPITKALRFDLISSRLPVNFKFAKKRIFESYFQGEQAGYKPVGKNIGALVGLYDQSFNRTLAARGFLKELHEGKAKDGRPLVEVSGSGRVIEEGEGKPSIVIKPKSKPEETGDYRPIDHPAMRGWKWVTEVDGKPVLLQGDLLVHPEAYQKLRNRLSMSAWRQRPALRAVISAQSTLKQTMLSLSGFHQVQETLHSLGHRVNPANLEKLDFENATTKELVSRGLQLADYNAMEAFAEGLASGPLTNKIPFVGQRLLKPYTEWLFQDYIPRLKLTLAKHALERNLGRYKKELASGKITSDQILELTANQANAAFGELPYRYWGRNPTLQDTLRVFLLAPDFLEARGRFVAQATKPYGREQLVALGLLASSIYVTARVMNQILDDDPHWNSKLAFSIVYKGHAYTLRSVPGDVMHLISDPRRFWYHRLSPIIGRGLVEGITGRDERGVKRDVLQQVKDMSSSGIPISLQKKDDMKLWESALNAFGIGTRRYTPEQEIGDLAKNFRKAQGKKQKFEFIYDPDTDEFRPLRIALANRDKQVATDALVKLEKTRDIEKIDTSIKRFFTKPMSGASATEEDFIKTLTPAQKKIYDEAQKSREEALDFFYQVLDEHEKRQKK